MKESFVIYKGFYEPLKMLNDEQMGKLFRSIFEYQINGVECTDIEISMAFQFFKNQFVLDDKKYQKRLEANRANGKRGGRPKPMGSEENREEAKEPNGLIGNPKEPKTTQKNPSQAKKGDTVTDTVTDTDTVTSIEVREDKGTFLNFGKEAQNAFDEYLKMRKRFKLSNSNAIITRLNNKLRTFKVEGYDPQEIILTAITNGWKDFYKPKEPPKATGGRFGMIEKVLEAQSQGVL